MKAKSIRGNSPREIQSSLLEVMGADRKSDRHGFRPTFACVFISVKQDRNSVCQILHEQNIDCIGATSSTEFTESNQSEGGIVIMLLEIDRNDYSILFEDIGEQTLADSATHLAQTALQKFSNPALIICSTSLNEAGEMLDGESLIRPIEKVIGSQVNMFGGMAGDDMTFTGTYVFTNTQSTDKGIVALVLNEDKISLHGMAHSGWKPVGLLRTITKCKKNLLYEIDGQPALDMYLKYLGEDITIANDRQTFFNSIGLYYPFQIERPGREPLMCNPLGYDKDENALMLETDVEEGTKFRFSTPPDFDIVETVVAKAKEIKENTDTDAEAVLIFSCASRLSALGPMAQQENEQLAKIWKAPMAGFYTYGEFGRAVNGKHEFHSTTCSWVALKEK